MEKIRFHFYSHKPRIRLDFEMRGVTVPVIGDIITVPKRLFSDQKGQYVSKLCICETFEVIERNLYIYTKTIHLIGE